MSVALVCAVCAVSEVVLAWDISNVGARNMNRSCGTQCPGWPSRCVCVCAGLVFLMCGRAASTKRNKRIQYLTNKQIKQVCSNRLNFFILDSRRVLVGTVGTVGTQHLLPRCYVGAKHISNPDVAPF